MKEGILKNQIILEASKRFDFSSDELNIRKYSSNFNPNKSPKIFPKKFIAEKLVSRDIKIFKIFARFPRLLNELDSFLNEIDTNTYELFSTTQKNAIKFISNCNYLGKNSHESLSTLKNALNKSVFKFYL